MTTKRKTALVGAIIEGMTMVAEAGRAHDLSQPSFERCMTDAKQGMEIALRAQALGIGEHQEKPLKVLHTACGGALPELRLKDAGSPNEAGG